MTNFRSTMFKFQKPDFLNHDKIIVTEYGSNIIVLKSCSLCFLSISNFDKNLVSKYFSIGDQRSIKSNEKLFFLFLLVLQRCIHF